MHLSKNKKWNAEDSLTVRFKYTWTFGSIDRVTAHTVFFLFHNFSLCVERFFDHGFDLNSVLNIPACVSVKIKSGMLKIVWQYI